MSFPNGESTLLSFRDYFETTLFGCSPASDKQSPWIFLSNLSKSVDVNERSTPEACTSFLKIPKDCLGRFSRCNLKKLLFSFNLSVIVSITNISTQMKMVANLLGDNSRTHPCHGAVGVRRTGSTSPDHLAETPPTESQWSTMTGGRTRTQIGEPESSSNSSCRRHSCNNGLKKAWHKGRGTKAINRCQYTLCCIDKEQSKQLDKKSVKFLDSATFGH